MRFTHQLKMQPKKCTLSGLLCVSGYLPDKHGHGKGYRLDSLHPISDMFFHFTGSFSRKGIPISQIISPLRGQMYPLWVSAGGCKLVNPFKLGYKP
jgi:hypothetical protein